MWKLIPIKGHQRRSWVQVELKRTHLSCPGITIRTVFQRRTGHFSLCRKHFYLPGGELINYSDTSTAGSLNALLIIRPRLGFSPSFFRSFSFTPPGNRLKGTVSRFEGCCHPPARLINSVGEQLGTNHVWGTLHLNPFATFLNLILALIYTESKVIILEGMTWTNWFRDASVLENKKTPQFRVLLCVFRTISPTRRFESTTNLLFSRGNLSKSGK